MLAYLISALLVGLAALLVSWSPLAAVVGAVLGLLWALVAMPTLAVDFLPVWAMPLLGAGIGLVFAVVGSRERAARRGRWAAGITAALGIVVLGLLVSTSAPIFHAAKYRALLGPVDTLQNTPELAPVDPARLRVVDRGLAGILAERALGEQGALGSQVEIGTMDLQVVGGEWVWVAPLNHSSLLRWLDNREGTPGYVVVSAVDSRDVRLVTELGGEPIRLRYNRGAYFGDEPLRRLYHDGYYGRGLADPSFEIDDEGRPYWVLTEYEHTIGFGGSEPVAAVLLDARTGESTRCRIADCPGWVDLIQPRELARSQVASWGEYVHGWWNPSGREKLKTTDGIARVLGQDGRQHYYTGITSVNADQGTTGYVLVDTRTGDASYFLQPGATETAAMASAEGAVQEKGYRAVFPTPYNVGGAWTYLVPLKDDAGFVKAIAFVAVENDQVVGVGETPQEALRKFRQVLAARGGRTVADLATTSDWADGVLLRVSTDTRGGDTYYYLLVEGYEDRAFVGASSLSPELPLTRVGDRVRLAYEENGRGVVDLAAFDNLGLDFRRSEAGARAEGLPAAADTAATDD